MRMMEGEEGILEVEESIAWSVLFWAIVTW